MAEFKIDILEEVKKVIENLVHEGLNAFEKTLRESCKEEKKEKISQITAMVVHSALGFYRIRLCIDGLPKDGAILTIGEATEIARRINEGEKNV